MKNTLQCIVAGLFTGLLVTCLLTVLVLLISNDARATEISSETEQSIHQITSLGDVESGSLIFNKDNHLNKAPLLETDVTFTITGMTARATVKQTFTNPEPVWQEAIYVFPLPDSAAVDHLRMKIGQRIIEGQVKEKKIARKTYEQAKSSGKKASLIEQERTNIFTTSVANIGPNESIIIEIEYQQIVDFDAGIFSLRFPLVVAPRYIPGNISVTGFSGSGWAMDTDRVPDASRITPPVLHPDQGKINPVKIRMDLDAGFRLAHISSSYHEVDIVETTITSYYIELTDQYIPADRDFVLTWQPEKNELPSAALFTGQNDNAHYAMVMLLPPIQQAIKVLSREIIYVIDTSGSMAGTSISQARSALALAIDRLKPGDKFNIIQFNNHTFQLFQQPRAVDPVSLSHARAYIAQLRANGGTEMADAMHTALNTQSVENGLRQIIFITDGSIGNEDQLFQIIQQKIAQSRLFTIGIGSAPNAHFMRRAARFGKGTFTFIGKQEEVQDKMESLFRKLESPVLSDISLDGLGSDQLEIWPDQIPDLYAGEPLLLTLKTDSLPDKLSINGTLAGRLWQSTLALNGGKQQKNIPVLWARNKIDYLMDRRLASDDKKQIRHEIIRTALEHHLVSQYTSLVAVDVTPARIREEILKTQALPVNLPAGWQYEKVFGNLPRTATMANIYFSIGIFLILLAVLFYLTRKQIYNV